jgi:hypothetical protein
MLLVSLALKTLLSISQNGISPITLNKPAPNGFATILLVNIISRAWIEKSDIILMSYIVAYPSGACLRSFWSTLKHLTRQTL